MKSKDGWDYITNLKDNKGNEDDEEHSKDCKCDDDNKKAEAGVAKGSDGNDNDDNSSTKDTKTASKKDGIKMPNTASNIPVFLLIGTLMVIAGGVLMFIRKTFIVR